MPPHSELTPARFWDAVRQRYRDALRCGALQPIATQPSFVRDRGVEFVVRVSDNLLRKRQAPASYERPRKANPFLPPDLELTVCSLPPHHIAVLNKFNVLAQHVLVVTRGFAHQESLLTAADFTAVAAGLGDDAGLAFYNAGKTAGASQPHKHFQIVPLPLGRDVDIPTAVLLQGAVDGVDTIESLRFRHAFKTLDGEPSDTSAFGRRCFDAYREAIAALGLGEPAAEHPATHEQLRLPPYNLLVTARWLLIVPRLTEHCADISVNGLGYAGSLFVSTPAKLEHVKTTGPMTLLERVSMPSP